ncbi:hypothetical protein ACLB2K_066142 [Fragaria x ananassa]
MKTDQYGILLVNTATSSYEDDLFVFATSVKQMFYLDDLAKGEKWKVVNLVHPRNIYRAATLGEAEDEEEDVAYQEPNAIGPDDSQTCEPSGDGAGGAPFNEVGGRPSFLEAAVASDSDGGVCTPYARDTPGAHSGSYFFG